MGKWISPNLSMSPEFGYLGHSNWTICTKSLASYSNYAVPYKRFEEV